MIIETKRSRKRKITNRNDYDWGVLVLEDKRIERFMKACLKRKDEIVVKREINYKNNVVTLIISEWWLIEFLYIKYPEGGYQILYKKKLSKKWREYADKIIP
jgi:hypothetical protein